MVSVHHSVGSDYPRLGHDERLHSIRWIRSERVHVVQASEAIVVDRLRDPSCEPDHRTSAESRFLPTVPTRIAHPRSCQI